jgi:photosystem II stability/assembly factor-like uncharacterized protein
MNRLKILSLLILMFFYFMVSFSQEPKIYFSLVGRKQSTVVGQDINVNGFFIGKKDGEKWERKGWKNNLIFGITIDKKSKGKNIFLACGNGVMRSTDYGENFKILTSWEVTEVQKVYLDPANNNIIYLTSSFGIWKSTDYGDTWSKKIDGLELVSQTFNTCMVILPSNSQTLIMGTADGIVISKNGGEKWNTLALKGKEIKDIQISPFDEKFIVCATEDDGLFISKDGGKNWKQSEKGLAGKTFYTIAFDPSIKGTLYCGGFRNGVQKSTDYGENWVQLNNQISDKDIHSLVVYPNDSKSIFAGSTNFGFYKSNDAGNSFKCAGECDGVVWYVVVE